MPTFTLTQSVVRPVDETTSRITDLLLGSGDQADVLYTTTRYDGRIESWDIAGTTLSPADSATFNIGPLAGSQPSLTFVGDDILSGGGTGGALTLRSTDAAGTLGPTQTLNGTTGFDGPLIQPVAVTHANGNISLYAGQATGSGVVQILLDPAGNVISTDETAAQTITTLTSATIDGDALLFTTGATSLSAWTLDATGTLSAQETLTPDTGLRIADPTAMEAVVINGTTYLIVAAAGSSSVTVIAANALGGLSVVDHVIDDRSTRFDGATALTTAQYQGQTWVFVGGADDGISAFQLLDSGRLIARGQIADTPDMTLANIAALAAKGDSTGIDVFAASATEAGLTRLRFTVDPDDQVIVDTASSDTLTGGAGADVFVLGADGQTDVIADFTVGEDRVDLSDWNGLRSTTQLFFDTVPGGLQITYGDEVLILRSADGADIAASDIPATDLIAPARIPDEITAGLPGPITTPPDLPERPTLADPTPNPTEPNVPLQRFGTRNDDTLLGTIGDDILYGMSGNDRLSGRDGNDLLFGGGGSDRLEGGTGDDYLFGGEGREGDWRVPAAPVNPANSDVLIGGAGNDELYGQAGRDRLDGGAGDDLLSGGSGRDTFVFRSGRDTVVDFNPGVDRIALDDVLWNETLTADQVVDRFATDTGSDTVLDFGGGKTLRLQDFDDLGLLADRIDLI